jgi:NADH dehydrogenase [ubiquinone] 1 alpha subcomplex assembly factor 1
LSLLFDFAISGLPNPFQSIDDRIMGGISQSSLQIREGTGAIFTGNVSAANGGGFASVRASGLAIDASKYQGVLLKICGDGKIYKLRLLNQTLGDPPVYESRFETLNGEEQQIQLAFADLEAVRRGQRILSAPIFNRAHIQAIGFLISDKQYGSFSLTIESISLY